MLDHDRVRDIVLATDDDANGRNLRHDLLLRLGAARCRVVEYPPACKDLNDVLRILGARRRPRLHQGCPAGQRSTAGMNSPTGSCAREFPALRTGMERMDEHYQPRLGDLTVITGIPGMGKSALVTEIVGRMANVHHWRFVSAPFETTKHELERDLRTFHSGILQKDMLPTTWARPTSGSTSTSR